MSTLLPPGLAFRPGFTPAPQNEKLGGHPAENQPTGKAAQESAPQEQAGTKAADPAGKTSQQPMGNCMGGGDMTTMLIPFGIMIAFMYFFMIRPQQKKDKERRAMLSALKKNDKVLTSAGMMGTVVDLDEKTVTLKVDQKGEVRIQFLRDAITQVVNRTQE